MKDLVIGDLHFGIKTNNVTWLEKQVEFMDTFIVPKIAGHDRVVFLGDLFDIRYSTNTQVGCCVKESVRKMLLGNPGTDFYFIAGNHDYYSPVIDFEEYNAYSLVFGEEFTTVHPNLHIIATEPLLDSRTLMLPWYYTEDDTRYAGAMAKYAGEFDVIYCHTACDQWTPEKVAAKGGATVFSGHIHYPWCDTGSKMFNVGAACAFTFNDVNSKRYIYTIVDGCIKGAYENTVTPKFVRYTDEEIFTVTPEDTAGAYVQLCVSSVNMQKALYIEQIKNIKTEFGADDVKTIVVDTEYSGVPIADIDFNTNMHEYIKKNIPQHLSVKYETVSNNIKSKKS